MNLEDVRSHDGNLTLNTGGAVSTTNHLLPLRPSLDLEQLRRINFHGKELLGKREYEVFLRVVGGMLNKEIAADLNVSIRTVEMQRACAMAKLKVNSAVSMLWLFLTSARAPFDPSK